MIINTGKEVDVVKSFKKRKAIVKILLYIAGLCITLSFFSLFHRDPTITDLPFISEIGIWIGVLIIVLIIAFIIWRCPKCQKFFGFTLRPIICWYCRTELIKADTISDSDAIVIMGKKKILLNLLMGVMILIGGLLLLFSIKYGVWLGIVGGIIIIIALPGSKYRHHRGPLIFAYFIWRCPRCDERLDEVDPERCPNCRTRL